ncbi:MULTISPECIES: nucleoid occlusion factor SlmA [Hahella]|uniref:Nucleoid occlusion factor SlmA n=1 Tax=Hahella chejuensis (strain KCTC 2396) TaxID=349521 RepID=Q2S9C8_HAHCH|nr:MULTISPECIES: nucleoid occlusion factor SlmA [Hahella]ABC32746.1 Transcriptional regulator [Hahella chejuensis KCTC 2396]AZZ94508.1 nucleoid occlusion factor SlmA [Hahella sp. KA22]MBU6952809.1 nucleoid occlusion factor SlmA [Hahella sp. HN01]MDG9670237.1 nucleoid occlusion factor SlmA [Hahella sp. CR1]QAY57881.1 nucleoid occlusion factor SlmA [Hahella sp. KA22]
MSKDRNNRKEQILQCLAQMLQDEPGERITTAKLAKTVGVSEAALYRHFPSKGRMFEGLFEFIEESIFSRIKLIRSEEISTAQKINKSVLLCLTFAQRNPGMCRLLLGDALQGEKDKLRARAASFFERLETEFRSMLRDGDVLHGQRTQLTQLDSAQLFLSLIEGNMHRFIRSGFRIDPLQGWDEHWGFISQHLFV